MTADAFPRSRKKRNPVDQFLKVFQRLDYWSIVLLVPIEDSVGINHNRAMILKFLIGALLAIAHADDSCTTVQDVAPNLGPVQNQGDKIDWCYGFTAADLLTQKLQDEHQLSTKERIHPVALTAAFHIDQWRNPSKSQGVHDSAKNVIDALPRLESAGLKLCTEANFGGSSDGDNPEFEKGRLVMMETFRNAAEAPSVRGECEIAKQGLSQLRKVLKEMNRASTMVWLKDLQSRCQVPIHQFQGEVLWFPEKHQILSQNKVLPWSYHANHDLQNLIDEALDHGKLAAIGYQASFMLKDQSYMHWSSIVARKKVNGVCQYQIRDSFGPDCQRYRADLNCKDGYIWVSREELLNHTASVYHLN